MEAKQKLKRITAFMTLIKILRRFKSRYTGLNLFKTVYINFKTQSLKNALKFPIFIYGKVKIYNLSGKIIIDAPISTGMICLGLNTDKFSASKKSAMILITGELVFKGNQIISVDYVLDIIGKCTIGEYAGIGNGVRIRCWNNITIGKSARIGVETQIFDTNFHYTRNIKTGKIYFPHSEVVIGDFCWVGNRTTIMKGTKLPDYSIVAGNSLLNKDYIKDAPIAPTIAGIPAKIISSGYVRVFSIYDEMKINDYFKQNPNEAYYVGDIGLKDETEELDAFFSSR